MRNTLQTKLTGLSLLVALVFTSASFGAANAFASKAAATQLAATLTADEAAALVADARVVSAKAEGLTAIDAKAMNDALIEVAEAGQAAYNDVGMGAAAGESS